MVTVHNFLYGLLTPVLADAMSCLGCFLGLRCTTRAREVQGSDRVRWLLLAAVSLGVPGIWGMHFVAMGSPRRGGHGFAAPDGPGRLTSPGRPGAAQVSRTRGSSRV